MNGMLSDFFLYAADNIFYVRLASRVLQNLPPKNDKMFVPYNERSLIPDWPYFYSS